MCALPVQFPGNTQTGVMGRFLKALNPMEAVDHVIEKLLVNNRTLDEMYVYLRSPIILPALVLLLLLGYAAPRLRLDAGIPPWSSRPKVASLLLVIGLLGALSGPGALAAPLAKPMYQEAQQLPLEISVNQTAYVVPNGTPILFQTQVTNHGTEASPPLIIAMNIINLSKAGDVVDPEDWSPQRTQYVDAVQPGAIIEHDWRVNTILKGDYMIYMVLIPQPASAEESSWPLTSAGIHVIVNVDLSANPSGVTPYAIGMPVVLLGVIVFINRYRRRGIDAGEG
jgi:hypothetical protein